MMRKRPVKTIEDARAAMLELLPAGTSLFVDVHWHDSQSRGHWHQTIRMSAAAWAGQREMFRVSAPTASDLYRSFCQAFNEFLKPRRLSAEAARDLRARAVLSPDGRAILSDEHDCVGGRQRITTIEAKRISGPAN